MDDDTNNNDHIRVRLPRPTERKRATVSKRKAPVMRRPMQINLVDDDDGGARQIPKIRPPPPLKRSDAMAVLWTPAADDTPHDDSTGRQESGDNGETKNPVDRPSACDNNGSNVHPKTQAMGEGNRGRANNAKQEVDYGPGSQQAVAFCGHGSTIVPRATVGADIHDDFDASDDKAEAAQQGMSNNDDGEEGDNAKVESSIASTRVASSNANRILGSLVPENPTIESSTMRADKTVHGIVCAARPAPSASVADSARSDDDDGDDSADDSSGGDDDTGNDDDPSHDDNGNSDDSDSQESRGEDSDGASTRQDDDDKQSSGDSSSDDYDDGDNDDDGDRDDGDDDAIDSFVAAMRLRTRKTSARVDVATDDGIWRRARVPPSQCVPLDEALVDKAQRGVLTVEDLDAVDPTAAFRLATLDVARPIVERWWGHAVRGLPMVAGADPDAPYALLPHQVHAMRWMRAREALPFGRVYGVSGGILSLRMGMGKTLTALAHILSAPRGEMPTLVLCSARVLQEWHASGVAKFFSATDADGAPLVRALYFHRDYMTATAMRAIDRRALAAYDIVLTTYDMCLAECRRGHYDEDCLERGPKGRVTAVHARARSRADRPDLVGGAVLYGTLWERIVCDESQRFANPTTSIYRAVMALYGRYKWCLTGTPIRNSHTDIWAQMRFLGYTGIASRAVWKRDGPTFYTRHRLSEAVLVMGYDDHNDRGNDDHTTPSSTSSSTSTSPTSQSTPVTQQARQTGAPERQQHPDSAPRPSTAPVVSRTAASSSSRSASVATPRLPPIHHREVIVTLSVPERQTYDAVLALARSALDDMRAQTSNFACVLSMFTRLRQVAVAAHLMTLGDGTSTRDEIMRVLRRADESLAATGNVAPREDPGAHATSMTPAATLAMDVAVPPPRTSVPTPSTAVGPVAGRPSHVSLAPQVDPAGGAGHTVTTTKTIVGPYQRTTTTTTTTAVASTPATPTNRTAVASRTDAVSDPNVLRVSMPRHPPRRLPPSMTPPPPQTPPTTTTIEIVDDPQGDAERAADDARESGMGLAMWCLDRRSRAGVRSAKMRAITRILGQVPADEKVLVFSSFAACLDLVADAVAARLPAMGVVQIDGDTPKRERDERLRAFRAAGGPRVLLMTYKIGAEGLNLAEANHCVCVEPWWTNAVHEQAYSRCWRVGQTRPVTVYNIIAAGTMEQRVVQVCRDKSATAAAYMASSASSRHAAAAASRRTGGEATLDLATLSRIIG
ncbi:SNF2 N-domain-containing protein incomplete domain containing protein [Pandoravirus celtis]|uniref:SNF2 N-domain-containing protein incomplete domain containing protein n=1 Tax=Pandoravirus celtis TaxID=2568002 RepID=A0A4D6EH91_9VIRU|nr:SNF2 N-domain-containing protein incomplete domain containing protein [Pandoravirus celtis]